MTEQPSAEQIARFLEQNTDIELTDWQRQYLEWAASGETVFLHYGRTQARRAIERALELVANWEIVHGPPPSLADAFENARAASKPDIITQIDQAIGACGLAWCDADVMPWLDREYCSIEHRILGQHPVYPGEPPTGWWLDQVLQCKRPLPMGVVAGPGLCDLVCDPPPIKLEAKLAGFDADRALFRAQQRLINQTISPPAVWKVIGT